MPDIKTALSSALKEWDKPITNNTEDKQMQTQPKYDGFKVTTNVGRRTFELVKNNPGILPNQITAWAKKEGLNPDSAYAMAAKSVRDGYMVRDSKSGYHTIVPEYRSPKTKAKKAQETVVKKEPSKGIKALLPIPKPEPTPILERKREEPFVLTAKYVIENIKVGEAKLLHKELTRIFTED
jgi:hypothetical protein